MHITQEIKRTKFELYGERFEGRPAGNQSLVFRLRNIENGRTTQFEIVFTIQWIWTTNSSFEFESRARINYPSSLKISLQTLIDVASDSFVKMCGKLSSHPDFCRLNLPAGTSMEFTHADINNITQQWKKFYITED